MRLLVVDFDFFVPIPEQGPRAALFDWGHLEAEFFIHDVWPARAAHLQMAGADLPQAEGHTTFWSRFTFADQVRLLVAESNAAVVGSDAIPRFGEADEVWLFDAHHDAGYGNTDPLEVARGGRLTCEDWMVLPALCGATLHVRYPQWRTVAMREPEPTVAVDRQFDDGQPDQEPFDVVFVCRSGAWVPPWCDPAFFEFINSCPAGLPQHVGSYPLQSRAAADTSHSARPNLTG